MWLNANSSAPSLIAGLEDISGKQVSLEDRVAAISAMSLALQAETSGLGTTLRQFAEELAANDDAIIHMEDIVASSAAGAVEAADRLSQIDSAVTDLAGRGDAERRQLTASIADLAGRMDVDKVIKLFRL